LGAFVVAALALISRSFDKSLSIREHEEFAKNVNSRVDQVELQYQRDDNRLEDRIKVLEQTRPTTGEIEARMNKGVSGKP